MLTQFPTFAGPVIIALHGLGHGGAPIALAWIAFRLGMDAGAWTAAPSWLLAAMSSGTATAIASGFWTISLVGFVAAALGMAGIAGPTDAWRFVAAVAAVVSLAGIVLFLGTWPAFSTIAAIAVNIAILAAVVAGR